MYAIVTICEIMKIRLKIQAPAEKLVKNKMCFFPQMDCTEISRCQMRILKQQNVKFTNWAGWDSVKFHCEDGTTR